MPTYTSITGSYPHERETFETIQRFDHPDLHLWPSLTRLGCNEIDLLLADGTVGLFAIEMKAHSLQDIRSFGCNEWQLHHQDKGSQSPVTQASRAAQQLAAALKERQATPHWICSTVLWSRIDRSAWESHFALSRRSIELAQGMLFRDDIESGFGNFREALKRVRRHPCQRAGHPPTAITDAEIDELVALLADDTAPTYPDIDRDRLRFLETRQAQQAAQDVPVDSGTRLSIRGLPGTGKTWALLSIARHHAATGKRVLFLCYNQVLHADLQRIGACIDERTFRQQVDFHTLFGFYEQFAANARIEPATYEDSGAQDWINRMAEELTAHGDRPKYDLIVVDEAQDMLDPLEPVLRHCISDDGSIVVAVGLGQELYRENADWLDRFQGAAKQQVFSDVYRMPAAAFCVAQALRESAVDEKLISAKIRRIVGGHCHVPDFLEVDLRNPGTTVPALMVIPGPGRFGADLDDYWKRELGKVFESARRRLRGGEALRDILFLLPSSKSVLRRPLHAALEAANVAVADLIADKLKVPSQSEVRVSTYHSARGVEARVVVLLDLAKLLENNPLNRNAQTLAYIGLTRSLRDTIIVEEKERRSRIGEMIEEIGERVRFEIDRERPRFLDLTLANLPEGYFANDTADDDPEDG